MHLLLLSPDRRLVDDGILEGRLDDEEGEEAAFSEGKSGGRVTVDATSGSEIKREPRRSEVVEEGAVVVEQLFSLVIKVFCKSIILS